MLYSSHSIDSEENFRCDVGTIPGIVQSSPLLLSLLQNYGNNGMQKGICGAEVGDLVSNYHDLLDLLPRSKCNAVMEPVGSRRNTENKPTQRRPLTHNVLYNFISKDFDLTRFGVSLGARVALILPNGPELAVTIISVVSRWCAAPINSSNTWQEIKSELESTKAEIIIVQAGVSHESALYAAGALGLGVLELLPSEEICGLFSITKVKSTTARPYQVDSVSQAVEGFVRYNHPETVLLLHTSGTSGHKKLVPYSLDMLIIGVGCIISSWKLAPTDVCLNMMPLYHIGGIVRNVFCPILSGGCVVACTAFDPVLFWDVLSTQRITSYYAAPTMHHAILMEAERRPKPLPVTAVRYIANAAGGLLPALAESLKKTFHNAVILTSYGMTECMPIASPPQNYRMDPIGTSGTKVGPSICISADFHSSLPSGKQGNIFIKGPPCFGGYENNGTANEESFFIIDGQPGWFNTGDLGHMDEEGYLFISGRSKEIINRGGETISPLEIEQVLIQHPLVQEALAFSVPHEKYQETVAAVIVTPHGRPRIDLRTLHKFLDDRLHRSKWPQVIVYMHALPKNSAGKLLRIRLGERLKLKPVDEETSLSSRLWEEVPRPIQGSSLDTPIDSRQVFPNPSIVTEFIRGLFGIHDVVLMAADLPSARGSFACCVTPSTVDVPALMQLCSDSLHCYLVPAFCCALDRLPVLSALSPRSPVVPISTATTATSKLLESIDKSPETLNEPSMLLAMHLSRSYDNMKIDEQSLLAAVLQAYERTHVVKPRDDLEKAIEGIWKVQLFGMTSTARDVAASSEPVISIMDNFFALGGDSLKAGQLINAMRKCLSVQGLTVPDLFSSPTISSMAKRIAHLGYTLPSTRSTQSLDSGFSNQPTMVEALSERLRSYDDDDVGLDRGGYQSGKPNSASAASPPTSSTHLSTLVIQAIPIVLLYPIRKLGVWFFIAQPWVLLMELGVGRLRALILSMLIARLLTGLVFPLLGILLKWLIIYKYRPGRAALWSGEYLRWWLVEQILRIFGKGFFSGTMPIAGNFLLCSYYRMLGAQIGKNVRISVGTTLAQADLVQLGDNVTIDDAIIRPFSLEVRSMLLLPIVIQDDCSVGARSVLSSGCILPRGTHIGPQSSSHELSDASIAHKKYCRPLSSSPPLFLMICLGLPIIAFVTILSYIPWYLVLRSMEQQARDGGWYQEEIHTLYDVFTWWCKPQRLPYYFALRILRKIAVPPIRLLLTIIVKQVLIGKFEPMEKTELDSPWNRFRYWLLRSLMGGGGDLCGVAPLVGTHYEVISVIYRLLGAKVGRRVYWPGSGFDVVDYDLLDIGNDVVFGSRSIIMTRSTERAAHVVIGEGAMLADRCVVLPGAVLAKGAVLGTGALARENYMYPMGSVWVGSQKGNAVAVLPEDTSIKTRMLPSAFGKAFYDRKASFWVYPLWVIILYSTAWQVFCCIYHNLPPVLAIFAATRFGLVGRDLWVVEVLKIILYYNVPVYFILSIVALTVDIAAKWLLLGRREPGLYPWDQSSYCQRWQVYLTLQEIRRGDAGESGLLELIQGSHYIVWYFRLLGCSIGKDVCLYPNGANPMMTEPELVSIADYAGVDDASLIAHLNTKGMFSLSTISVGEGCVLKAGSRLMAGAAMGRRSMLLEHTLILSGDYVTDCSVWQGWPSKVEVSLRSYQKSRFERIDQIMAMRESVAREEVMRSRLEGMCGRVSRCFCNGCCGQCCSLNFSLGVHSDAIRAKELTRWAFTEDDRDEEEALGSGLSEATGLLSTPRDNGVSVKDRL